MTDRIFSAVGEKEVTRAIVGEFAKEFAEYVESEAILNALRKLEVDYAQGYAIGRPTPLKQLSLEKLLV